MLVNSVWAPGETRPMCRQVACREGSGPLPYLTLTLKHMRHLGKGILGGPQRNRIYPTGLPAPTMYLMAWPRVEKASRWTGKQEWRPEHGIVLDGPLRGVWECACGWYVDDASEDVRRGDMASLLAPVMPAGRIRYRNRVKHRR